MFFSFAFLYLLLLIFTKKISSTLQFDATWFLGKSKSDTSRIKLMPSILNIKCSFLYKLKQLKRTSLCCLKCKKSYSGIITVEAAIALPIFIFAISCILYIFNIFYVQSIFQDKLYEISTDINNYAYAISLFSDMSESTKQIVAKETESDIVSSLSKSLISSAYIKSKFLTGKISTISEKNYIKNGSKGLSFLDTYYDEDDNYLSIKLSYEIIIPFLPDNITIPITQYLGIRLFTGLPMTQQIGDTEQLVYMTSSGRVYHTDKYCTYLVRFVEPIEKGSITLSLYDCCIVCKNDPAFNNWRYAYMTEHAIKYHYNPKCRTIYRDIYTLKLSDVVDNCYLCSKCENSLN